jgi:hypothetical protein
MASRIRNWFRQSHKGLRKRVVLQLEALENRLAPAITNPTWQAIGPAPEVLNGNMAGIGNPNNPTDPANPANPASGAVQVLRLVPNSTIAYIGTVNGGVWDTLNYTVAAPKWVALTDGQASLSIRDIAISQVPDGMGKTGLTIYAATGNSSNYSRFGAGAAGIYKITIDPSTGKATSITTLGQSFGTVQIGNLVVTGTALVNGQLQDQLVAGTLGAGGAIYTSTNGGESWTLKRVGTPGMRVTDLVQVPATGAATPLLFAAIAGAQWRVLKSTNNGESWESTALNPSNNNGVGTTDNIRLAVSGTASAGAVSYVVYAAMDVSNNFKRLFRSADAGKTWTALTDLPGGNAPLTNAGVGQGAVNLSLAADPTNKNIVYIAGSTAQAVAGGGYFANIWRGTVSGTTTTWVKLVTATVSPHADSRNMFLSGGSLYEVDDGGIYKLANPAAVSQTVAPVWSALVGNLQDSELYSAAYDTLSGAYLAGAQDNGLPVQILSNGTPGFVPGFFDKVGGDGSIVAVDDITSRTDPMGDALSARFYSYVQMEGFQQAYYTNKGAEFGSLNVNFTLPDPADPKRTVTVNGGPDTGNNIFEFVQPFVLNQTTPTLMLVGGRGLGPLGAVGSIYQADFSTGQLDPSRPGFLDVALHAQQITGLLPVPTTDAGGTITALAYANVAYVGTNNPNGPLLIRAAGATSFANETAYAGGTPLAITVDPRDSARAYILDAEGRVWVTLNAGDSFTQIGGTGANVAANLPALPTSTLTFGAVTIIPTGAGAGTGEAVLVSNPPGTSGGGVFIAQIPAGTAAKPPDFTKTSWQAWGNATQTTNPGLLPDVQVNSLQYYQKADLVVASTIGRGIWAVPNASSYIGVQAPVVKANGQPAVAGPIIQPLNRPIGAAPIPAALTVSAAANDLLTEAVVTLNGRRDGNDEFLTVDLAGTDISAAYDASTGTLTLTGIDTAAHYQQVLQSIDFNDLSPAPSPVPRQLTVQVSDGVTWSDTATITLNIIPNNPDPSIDLDGTDGGDTMAAFTEGQGPVTLAPSLTLADPESATLALATVRILNVQNMGSEFLAADTSGTSISASYNAQSGVLSLFGSDSLADYQKVLRTVTYNDVANVPGPLDRAIAFTLNDGISTSPTAEVAVSVTAVKMAPVLANAGPFSLPAAGITVAKLLAGKNGIPIAQDLSGYAISGIAVIGVDNSQGVWQYRTDPAQPWQNMGNPTDGQALLLFNNADTSIRFVPTVSGTVKASLRFRVWDGTGEQFALEGLAGGDPDVQGGGGLATFDNAVHVNTIGSGGSSPFSAGVGTLTSVATGPSTTSQFGIGFFV